MPHLAIDGKHIEFRTVPGDGHRPWLVFLHEGLGSVSLWRDFPEKVARRTGCRALIYSRIGYGQSDGLDTPRTPRFMHEEAEGMLPKILAALSIERPILVGHSDGASIALVFASVASNRVRAVIAMAPHVMVEPISVESIAKIAETYQATDLRARLARHHKHVDDAFYGWARTWLSPPFRNWSIVEEISRLACPALLIQGVDDEYGTLAQLDAIERVAKGPVQRLALANCGHSPHRDQEVTVVDAIAAFVEKQGSRF